MQKKVINVLVNNLITDTTKISGEVIYLCIDEDENAFEVKISACDFMDIIRLTLNDIKSFNLIDFEDLIGIRIIINEEENGFYTPNSFEWSKIRQKLTHR